MMYSIILQEPTMLGADSGWPGLDRGAYQATGRTWRIVGAREPQDEEDI